jgi:hypothetical protein
MLFSQYLKKMTSIQVNSHLFLNMLIILNNWFPYPALNNFCLYV